MTAVVCMLSAACSPSRSQTTSRSLALTHVTVIDGTGAPPKSDMTVLIDNGRITRVQPSSTPIPAGTAEMNLAGRYVIPGLIDAHVHLGTQQRQPGMMEQVLRACFMGGLTSVRDMGGKFSIVDPLARRARSDTVPMPTVVYSAIVAGPGSWIEGERGRFMAGEAPLGEGPTVRRLLDSADAVAAVASAKAAGAGGIKIYNTIAPSLVRIVAAEARRKGLRVWSHLFVDPGLPSNVIEAGAEVVSHGDMFVAEVLDSAARGGPTPGYRAARAVAYADTGLLSRPSLRRLITSMKERNVILDPTLYVMRPGRDSAGRIDPLHANLFHGAVRFTQAAHRAGIDVAAGTDAIGGSTPNIHVELQLLVDSVGMTPLQAIRAGTYVSARALGIGDSVGTVAPGKRADLVVLAADPSVDIANTITVIGTMKAGRYYPRERPMSTPPGARSPSRTPPPGTSR